MALFHMKRFMDEDEGNFGENRSSESILEELHAKAKTRERQSHDSQSHDKSPGKIGHDGSTLTESPKKGKKSKSQTPKIHGTDKKEERPTISSAKKRKLADVVESSPGRNKVKKKKSQKVGSQTRGESSPQESDTVNSDFKQEKQPTATADILLETPQENITETNSDEIKSQVQLIKKESGNSRSDLREFRENAKTAKKQKKTKVLPSGSKLKSKTIDADSNRTEDNLRYKLEDFKEEDDDNVILKKEIRSKSLKSSPKSTKNTLKTTQETSPEPAKQKRKPKLLSNTKSKKHLKVSLRTEENKKDDGDFVSGVEDTSFEFVGCDDLDSGNEDSTHAVPEQELYSSENDSASSGGSSTDAEQEEMDLEVSDRKHDSVEVENEEETTSQTDNADEDRDDESKMETGTEDEKGFALLGSDKQKKKQRVARVLPDWLAHPTLIEHDLKKHSIAVEDMKQLDSRLVRRLLDEGMNSLFPVQRHVIPVILDSVKLGIQAGNAGYRPRDLCVSAPTGSGKTLAFALPIVQALLDRVVPRIRALVVLPTRDLAQQVSKVFSMLCKGIDLRTSLIGGLKKFSQEQRMLVQNSSGESECDIVVATPGRLVDHINKTQGFTLQSLRFLVIDEADRMMDQISKDWISQVEKCVFVGSRRRPGPITVDSCRKISLPLQKLLFSATLSQNPEKLIQLNLFQPRLVTSVVSSHKGRQEAPGHDGKGQERGEFVGKYTTPVGLTEYYLQCTSGEKPLVVLHLIQMLNLSQILCFANTVEATHRLYHLIKLVGGIDVAEFSSNQTAGQRRQILKQFKTGKIQLLICSDAMARGMDVENAKYVISYDMPPYIKTYIHRVGRTARAGKTGTAFSLLQQYEVPKLLKLLKHAGKTSIQQYNINRREMESLEESYEKALQQLPGVLKMEKAHSV